MSIIHTNVRTYRKINPLHTIVKHLTLLEKAVDEEEKGYNLNELGISQAEIRADGFLCDLIDYVEDGGWTPTKKQVLSAAKRAGVVEPNFVYLRTIGKFCDW